MAIAPSSSSGYAILARALAAEGRPRGAVEEALSQKWSRLTPAAARRVKLTDEANLALLFGDFATAKAKAGELEADARDEPSEMDHGPAVSLLVDIADELGDRTTAARIASDYLTRREGWAENPHRDELAIAGDVVPAMLAARARAGRLDKKALEEQRAAWVAGWERRASPFFRSYLWGVGYAATVESREEAEQALAVLPRFGPLPREHRNTMSLAARGQTYLLAGRTDEARPLVESGARVCRALEQPIAHTRAQLALGMVREAADDREGACAAYRVVLTRWGEVKGARTAADARARSAALRCAR
jgi:serine/threonine-protein kinase